VDRLVARAGPRSGPLTGRDVELLDYLRRAQGRVVGRQELLREVWGYARTDAVETRCIDMHVAKLRKKLQDVVAAEVIETVRGAGYRLP
jgi:DNA-binding response OmpR family regulator